MALLAALFSVVVHVPSAQASSTILCRGFTGCANAGYSSFGYAPVYRQMWWRMYAGHNCTNYVAYRMVSRGMSATRPWSGSGDARNWGVVFSSKVSQTPAIGSVAWWSSNHVAYVQQIIDANTIVISEDHYGGDFDWRRITRAGGGWPTGFIHLNDEVLSATTAPTWAAGLVGGAPKVGLTMKVNAGTWVKATSVAVQWLANGAAIPAATALSYVPTADVLGKQIAVRVTASAPGYQAGTATTTLTKATNPGTFTAAAPPAITGIAKVAGTLSASTGSFAPAPASYTYSWAADGVAIPGATAPTLVLPASALGKTITVTTTARRPGYLDRAGVSTATAKVGPEKITLGREPQLTGSEFVGRRLTVNPGVSTPADVAAGYVWMRDGVVVPGQVQNSYPLGSADVGARISARVTYAKPGYTTVVRTLAARGPVRSFPRISVVSRGHRSLTVSVKALGVDTVRGQVVVRTPSGSRRTLTLVRGTVTFTAPWIYAGTRGFAVDYLGSYLVTTGTAAKQVVVR